MIIYTCIILLKWITIALDKYLVAMMSYQIGANVFIKKNQMNYTVIMMTSHGQLFMKH